MKLLQTLEGHTDRVWSLSWNLATGTAKTPLTSSPLAVAAKPFKSTNTIPQIDYQIPPLSLFNLFINNFF